MFNVEKTTAEAVQWIRDWFEANGKGCNAVVGISGGKDSSVVAALCNERRTTRYRLLETTRRTPGYPVLRLQY